MSKAAPKSTPSKSKHQKQTPTPVSVGLFDYLNQALSEFIHTEHINPQSYVDTVDQCILNKKEHPTAVDPVVFAFSEVSNPPEGLLFKYFELLKVRYLRNLSQIFTSRPNEFFRFHSFVSHHIKANPDLIDFLCSLAQATAETESQTLANLFMKTSFSLYSPFLQNKTLLPHIISLIFAHTESDEGTRESRISFILDKVIDDETRFLVLANTVMQEKIFSSKLCDLYASFVEKGLDYPEFQPYAIHILKYLCPIKSDLLQTYLPKISTLVEDERPTLQTALIQLLVDSSQETLLSKLIEHTDKLDSLSLCLHLVSELGTIPSQILISLFKKIGAANIENVCSERCTVESPVGPLNLGRLTNTWNSAAVNAAVIAHIQSLQLTQWDVEFALCKLLLKQPMDTASSQIWQQLFARLAPQFGDLMRDEEMSEVVFDIVQFYLTATLDSGLLEKLEPHLEPIVTLAKEKCKAAGIRFLTKIAELGPKFKQIVSTLIVV